MSTFIRKIKNDNQNINKQDKNLLITIQPDETQIDPFTLRFVKNKEKTPMCITNFYIKDGKLSNTKYNCSVKRSKEEISDIMEIPPFGLDLSSVIDIYQVTYIDQLTEWVINQISAAKPYSNINRVVNAWIKVNYEKVKKYNNGLEKIFILLMKYSVDSDVLKKFKLDKEVKQFIDFYIEKHNGEEFSFNLGEEMIKYLLK
jgi:hypothetical protein